MVRREVEEDEEAGCKSSSVRFVLQVPVLPLSCALRVPSWT